MYSELDLCGGSRFRGAGNGPLIYIEMPQCLGNCYLLATM